jgi:hypothetical protein
MARSDRHVLGAAEDIDLEIHRNADTSFTVYWWADPDDTIPVPLSAAHAQVRDSDREDAVLVLDLQPFITIDGNAASVNILGTSIAAEPALQNGAWDMILISDTGEKKKVAEGNATIKRGATR